jgi:hypothetical protein
MLVLLSRQAYFRRGSEYMVSAGLLMPALGVFQNLMAQKNHEEHAFALLDALVEGTAAAHFSSQLMPLMQIVLTKLQSSGSQK